MVPDSLIGKAMAGARQNKTMLQVRVLPGPVGESQRSESIVVFADSGERS